MLTALLLLSLSSTPPSQLAHPEDPSPTSLAPYFRQPERVEIFVADTPQFLLKKGKVEKEEEKHPSIGPFAIRSKGVELSAKDRQALVRAWVAPEDVSPTPPTRCIFNPDIALRFWRGKAWVDAVVCLSCSELVFFDEKGQPVDGGSFQDFSVLSKLAKKTFPQEQFGR